jgi:hypothetical protein
MKAILLVILTLFVTFVHGQRYYQDIINAKTLGDRMKDYLSNKVTSITATGYDGDGRKSNEFNEWQYIDADKYALRIITRTGTQINRQRYQFDASLRLLAVYDSAGQIKTTTTYSYDGNNNITSIKTATSDSLSDFNEVTEHAWKYNAAGKPEKMWRVLNGKDSIEYRFATDEKGNVTDERQFRWNKAVELIYYYYNDNGTISDIVRYDKSVEQLLPDQVFEYDENNRMIQRTTLVSIVWRDFLIWRYIYNDKGLKTKEAMFSKAKDETGRNVLKGRIDYVYSFAP